jgi:Ca-activated chloride channel homolog
MMGGGSARAALAAAAIAIAVALGACGGGDDGDDASAAPLKRGDREPANFLIVLDASGAMAEDDRLQRARESLDAFAAGLPADDSVGLAAYSDRFTPLVPISPVGDNRDRLRDALITVRAGGDSALNDATLESYGVLRELAGANRIDGVLLIAHAPDSASEASTKRVRELLGEQRGGAARVQVITIAYDGGPRAGLAEFARASGGRAYASERDGLEAVLRQAWNGL